MMVAVIALQNTANMADTTIAQFLSLDNSVMSTVFFGERLVKVTHHSFNL